MARAALGLSAIEVCLGLLLALGACANDLVRGPEGLPCPCLDGYRCDPVRKVCIRDGAKSDAGGSSSDAGASASGATSVAGSVPRAGGNFGGALAAGGSSSGGKAFADPPASAGSATMEGGASAGGTKSTDEPGAGGSSGGAGAPDDGAACTVTCDEPVHSRAVCISNRCGFECDSGYSKCGNACVNLDKDRAHCGDCNARCETNEKCSLGKCAALRRGPA
jgi:hypothetical protein